MGRNGGGDPSPEDRALAGELFEAAPDGVLLVAPDGRILRANGVADAIFGYGPGNLAGRPLETLLPERARARHALHREAYVRAPMARPMKGRSALVAMRADGSEFPVEVGLSSVRAGDELLLVAFVRDISERCRVEEALRQSQRTEALGRLARGVAHDFNNLLTIILGCSDLILRDHPMDAAGRALAQDIRDAGGRASSLTGQLLAFARRQHLQPRLVDPNALIGGMVGILHRLAGKAIALEFRPHPNVGRILVDPSQFEQIVLNLTTNACDAMPKGGRIVIETAVVEIDEARAGRHPGARPGPHVLLSVSDTGCGMDAETLRHAFEPFFSTKGSGKGTGLGLATVFGVAMQSGGHVEVESEPGRGAAFRVFLPQVCAEVRSDAGTSPEGSPVGGTETVLLAEDDPFVRELLVETMRSHGYVVLATRDGGEALATGLGHPGPLAMLVTDLHLPVLDGVELARQLREARPGLRVAYLSGDVGENAPATDRVPAGRFLQKPMAAAAFLRMLRSVLDAPLPG